MLYIFNGKLFYDHDHVYKNLDSLHLGPLDFKSIDLHLCVLNDFDSGSCRSLYQHLLNVVSCHLY
jgi:hypothetical protein